MLMRDEKWEELEVQKQSYDVKELWSPQPIDMSRTMVLSGRSAHDGRAEYSGTLLMKMEVRWASERERNNNVDSRDREVFGAIVWWAIV